MAIHAFDVFNRLSQDEAFRNSVVKPQLTTAEKVSKFIIAFCIMFSAGGLAAGLTLLFAPLGPYAPVLGSGLAFAVAITLIGKLEEYFNNRATARILENLSIIPTQQAVA